MPVPRKPISAACSTMSATAILATDPETYSRMFYEFEDNHALCARETEVRGKSRRSRRLAGGKMGA